MSERVWDTRHPLDPTFGAAWTAVLARSPHANFTLDAEFLRWEAGRGRTALAVMIDEPGRSAAFVLRREGAAMACGWPWRWQAVVPDPRRRGTLGLCPDEAAWLLDRAGRVARGRQVRCYLPVRPPRRVAGYLAGRTLLYRIDQDDDEILEAIHPAKRRLVRRALEKGYEVFEADTPHQFSVFAQIQRETKERHRLASGAPLALDPHRGLSWREWELPWMWLLVAARDGRVESGLGDGVRPGGMLEGRAAGSTLAGQRDGAFALLSYEEARRGRDRGYHLINLGGDTVFKREMAGRLAEPIGIWCWLGGVAGWDLAGRAEVMMRRARKRTMSFVRRLRRRSMSAGLGLLPTLTLEGMLGTVLRMSHGWTGTAS